MDSDGLVRNVLMSNPLEVTQRSRHLCSSAPVTSAGVCSSTCAGRYRRTILEELDGGAPPPANRFPFWGSLIVAPSVHLLSL